jgi:DNA (cytosine-5)-methyltransferase 1
MIKLLDLFCGAGGAGTGYHRAGFEVVGVDIQAQSRYPFEFYQADALEYLAAHWQEFDVIHASPPCQGYSRTRNLKTTRKDHPMLIEPVRKALRATGKPFVIENVVGAPLINALILCGSMFRLGVLRHRLFECNPPIYFPPSQCQHDGPVLPMWWKSRREALEAGKTFRYITVAGRSYLMPEARQAMGIDWMIRAELSQAIPPAYTEYIGGWLAAYLDDPSLNARLPDPATRVTQI